MRGRPSVRKAAASVRLPSLQIYLNSKPRVALAARGARCCSQLTSCRSASRAQSLTCPTRTASSICCCLKCITRSACRVHLPPQHSNIESAGTRDGYQYGCAIAFGSRTTDAPRSACGRSHAKVIFEHATVAHFSSGSWRPRYSATHGAVPRLLAASTTESTLRAREPRETA